MAILLEPDIAEGSPGINSYEHPQDVAASVWTINHNLGYKPNIFIEDTDGVDIEGEITHVSVNQATVAFFAGGIPVIVSGKAYCS